MGEVWKKVWKSVGFDTNVWEIVWKMMQYAPPYAGIELGVGDSVLDARGGFFFHPAFR